MEQTNADKKKMLEYEMIKNQVYDLESKLKQGIISEEEAKKLQDAIELMLWKFEGKYKWNTL